MLFLHGETGNVNHYKFSKKINGKQFFYTGTADHGIFIEEIVYNGILKIDEELKDEHLQAIVIFDDMVLFINLNDSNNNQFGESTIVYSRLEFTDKEIMQFISDFILSEESIFFIEYKNEEFLFNRELGQISKNFSLSDLNPEKLISGTERIKSLMKENIVFISAISLTVIIPLITFFPLTNKITELDTQIELLSFQENKLKFDKKKKEIEVTSTSKKYYEIEKMDDIFTSEKLMSELLSLKIVPSVISDGNTTNP